MSNLQAPGFGLDLACPSLPYYSLRLRLQSLKRKSVGVSALNANDFSTKGKACLGTGS